MLPDTGERYLSTPLFADVPVEMTPDEQSIFDSTPSASRTNRAFRLAAHPGAMSFGRRQVPTYAPPVARAVAPSLPRGRSGSLCRMAC
uniref:Uncharacterized protein n=1 Tax=Phenylobacterium glaciei TaxID=2803784 RepID=A0A974P5Y9_9CAUL|nr:hypothetical protein JKL49_09925 [Phenylobacterium glaciei]